MQCDKYETVILSRGAAKVAWRGSAHARKVTLRIDPRHGFVVVTLPPSTTRAAGMAVLMHHAEWVTDRLAALPKATAFTPGAVIPVYGTPCRIQHRATMPGGARLEAGEIQVTGDVSSGARHVGQLLRGEALKRMSDLVAAKSASARVSARRVIVKDTHSRWGSCSVDGTLMFSWRLVMAPRYVQEYVASHEVAHLRHMNHGSEFWRLVDQLTCHAPSGDAWLRSEGPALLRIG